MTRQKKSAFLIITSILFACFIFGIVRISILEARGQEIIFEKENTLVDDDVHTQDNYILLAETGGLKSFPFIWSEVLYLYDIETEKTYFIDIAKIPYESYRRCFIIGDNVYFEKSVIKEAPTLKQKNLTTGKVKQLDISSRSFIATEESLLYWNRHESGAQSLNLYKDGSTEVLIPEDVEDITSIDTEVYWFKECESAPYEVYEYDLNNLKSSLLKFSMEHQGWIQKINMSEYLFVDQFTLYKWSNKTKSKQRLTKEGDVVDSVFYKDGMVYYKRENQTIVKLDPMTETTQICVDIELHRKMKEDVDCDAYIDSVDYCEDYIAVFLVEEIGSKYLMTLLFFDYEGNYIGQY